MLAFQHILLDADSVIIANIHTLAEKVASIDKKVTVSPYIPIISAFLGGVLVWFGQFFERSAKRKQELVSELNDLFTKCEMLQVSIKNSLKQLSIQKNLSSYWWYCYEDEFNAGEKKNREYEKKYLTNHHASCDSLIACTIRVGDLIAEYYSTVSKFKILSKITLDINFLKGVMLNADFSEAKAIDSKLNNAEALNEYYKNCKELANEYYEKFNSLESLNENLKAVLIKLK